MKQNWWSNYKIPFLRLTHIVSGHFDYNGGGTGTILHLFFRCPIFTVPFISHIVGATPDSLRNYNLVIVKGLFWLSVSKHGFCVLERCFGQKSCLLSTQHCKLLSGNGPSSINIFYLYVRYIGYIPLRCPLPYYAYSCTSNVCCTTSVQ